MQRLRRTMLYVPGNNPGMIKDVHIYGSDSIMFDLEDSVSLGEKDSARYLVHTALSNLNYGNVETVVRINGLDSEYGLNDLEAIVRAKPDIIRLPKTETAQDIHDVEGEISRIERAVGMEEGTIKLMAAVESALGIINAYGIATASKRLVGIAIGAEDFVTDLKTTRSLDGIELLTARSQLLMAARAARIDAIDTVFSDVNNEEAFINEVKLIKQLGFDGKSIINPRQIAPVHEIFTPSQQDIDKALRIMEAIEIANKNGSGVISLNGKMIDKPIVERARRVVDLAKASGITL
ncbi:MAG: citrate lyase, beta subunit [Clostridia bacterium]|nr:citrate lyase, beta subunit [Clostridia bacterium]